jgi:hypothetical protein
VAIPRDQRLEGLLATLSARLGYSSETAVYVGADECEGIGELADALVDAGLLLPAEPVSAVICDGCEQNCAMSVEIAPAVNERPGRAFIVCDKRDDIGSVHVKPARLRRWTFSLPLFARALAKALKTDQEPAEVEKAGVWQLGKAKVGGAAVLVTLVRSADTVGPQPGLTIALAKNDAAARGRGIAMAKAFGFRDGRLSPRADILRSAMAARFDDPTVAFEIRFDFGVVWLINRIEGGSTKIAAPHLDSQTDRVFKVLVANPEQTFTASELKQRTGLSALKSLHKIPENLHFSGNLKKLFFEVSKQGIRFRREVTLGQLTTYRIDPTALI